MNYSTKLSNGNDHAPLNHGLRRPVEPALAIRSAPYGPPARVWERTPAGLWASRDWRAGEREEYERKVLWGKS